MADETFDVLLRVKAEGDEALKVLTKQLAVLQTETKKTQNALVETGRSSGGFRNSLQNLGFQAQDFTVQVAGGTSALRAFGQQAPQAIGALQQMFGETTKLGAFLGGPWGIALGVAAAAVGPLIQSLFTVGETAKETADKFTAAMRQMRGEADAAAEAAALKKLDDQLQIINENTGAAGREAALRRRAAELLVPALRAELQMVQGLNKAYAMGRPSLIDPNAKKAKADNSGAKAIREAQREAEKALKEQARLADDAAAGVERALAGIGASFRKSDEEQAKWAMGLERAADPVIKFTEELGKLTDAYDRHIISQAAYDYGVKQAMDDLTKYTEATQGANEQQNAMIKSIADGWDALGKSSADALAGLITGAMKARDAVKSLLTDLLQLLAKQAVLKLFGGSSAGSFGSAILKAFSAQGNIFGPAGMVPFARGGIVDRPTVFPFAGGVGLMGEAGPEAVVPMRRDAAGRLGIAATPVNVNIHNNAGAVIAVSDDGAGNIDVIVSKAVAASRAAVASDVSRGGNALARSLEKTYGINRAMGAY